MENIKTIEILKKLKELTNRTQIIDEIEKHSVETLDLLAIELYEKSFKIELPDMLDTILYERAIKLNKVFKWTDENKQKLLSVNNKFMKVCEKTYNKAVSAANDLELGLIKDYEIEIEITPYMDDEFCDDDRVFGDIRYVLSEPNSRFSPISFSFDHSKFQHKEHLVFLNKNLNWNIEYFGDTFKDNYICYEIHALLDSFKWSFSDIINIKKIETNITVKYHYFIEDI
jgi:hypothetical protein